MRLQRVAVISVACTLPTRLSRAKRCCSEAQQHLLPSFAVVAQLVEQRHGKAQVVSSNLTNGSEIGKPFRNYSLWRIFTEGFLVGGLLRHHGCREAGFRVAFLTVDYLAVLEPLGDDSLVGSRYDSDSELGMRFGQLIGRVLGTDAQFRCHLHCPGVVTDGVHMDVSYHIIYSSVVVVVGNWQTVV